MNNKGQSTVLFILLVPVFLLILAFIFDNGMMIVEKIRLNSTTKIIIKDLLTNSYTNYEEMAKSMYEKNKIETELLDVKYKDDVLTIYNSHSFPSSFGRLLGIKSYRVESGYQGYVENDKVIIKEVENG